jgi:hypothetical protein
MVAKFIRKILGVDKENAATYANANAQIAANKESSQAVIAASSAQAKAAADQQSLLITREAVAKRVSALQEENVTDGPDVSLVAPATESVAKLTRKRRARFGQDYDSGQGI